MHTLQELYYSAVLLSNDLKHIHTHAIGNRFDRIHSIANKYYERATSDSDTLAELALEYNKPVQNPSLAASLMDYKATNQTSYYWEEAIATMSSVIGRYINELEFSLTAGLDSDVENLIQEYLRYWKKENNYKNKKRMEG